ncbi:hypothetical protein CDD83_1668 [Cordyceps sp. RAO-2017]|nr:hypothetical protein CDD83_1668 [Cordyceps sp. RAO-2017]
MCPRLVTLRTSMCLRLVTLQRMSPLAKCVASSASSWQQPPRRRRATAHARARHPGAPAGKRAPRRRIQRRGRASGHLTGAARLCPAAGLTPPRAGCSALTGTADPGGGGRRRVRTERVGEEECGRGEEPKTDHRRAGPAPQSRATAPPRPRAADVPSPARDTEQARRKKKAAAG